MLRPGLEGERKRFLDELEKLVYNPVVSPIESLGCTFPDVETPIWRGPSR